jgi:uncharacterized membrane protein SpoIIM required for sporulation
MKQTEFVKNRQPEWDRFASVIADKKLAEEADLPKIFRQISHDLAIAKSRQYSPTVVNELNDLLLQGQQLLYKPNNHFIAPLKQFFKHTFPEQLIQSRSYVLWAHGLFYGFALLFFIITIIEPEFVRNVMANKQVVDIEYMYDPTSEHYAKERESDGDFQMFGFYIYNNISIAFQCFVGGVVLGFGTLYFLLFNAIFFGAVSAHIVNVGYSSTFFSFVITHGAFELTAIVLSAAAGLIIGMSLLSPGNLTRADALKQAAVKAFPIIFGAFLLLVIAAFVEAFWSSSRFIPDIVKFVVGSACWIWVLSYVFQRKSRADR